jgi:predicted DNA-binding transcriptional regulator YafY
MADKNHKERLRELLILLRRQNEARPVTTRTVMEHLTRLDISVNEKTIRRDINELIHKHGAPLEWDASANTWRLEDLNWSLPPELFGSDEVAALLRDLKVARHWTPPGFADHDAVNAEQLLLSTCPEKKVLRSLRSFILASPLGGRLESDICETVFDAWRDCHSLEIEYVDAKGKESRREVDPHALFCHEGDWYIQARCRMKGEFRSFALHRIRQAKDTRRLFDRDPDLAAKLEHQLPFSWDWQEQVRLRLSPRAAAELGARQVFPDGARQVLADGGLELSWDRAGERQILAYVLAAGGEVEVVAPKSLRDLLMERIERLAKLHGENKTMRRR